MNEKTILAAGPCEARGRVTLRYTDPLTGRVLEEVKGHNSVFTAQLQGTKGFQSTAMKADLLLCRGGTRPAKEGMPFIPGDPIGYGRPGLAGAGLYRGAYRAADSWLDRRTKNGVSSKYVYDFLPTQALGRVDFVGLTAALGAGASVPAYEPLALGFTASNRVYDCENHRYFRLGLVSGDTGYRVTLYHKTCFEDAEETVVDLCGTAGIQELRTSTSYPRNLRVFWDREEQAVYGLLRGTFVGSTATIYQVFKVTLQGELLGRWSITIGNEYATTAAYPGAARDGKLYWMIPAADYRSYTRYVCNAEEGVITAVEVAVQDGSPNLLRWDSGTAYLWGDCFWYPRRDTQDPDDDDLTGFLYGSPLFDLGSGAVHGLVPPGPLEETPLQFHVGPSPIAAFGGQWIKTAYDDSALSMPFAYTCYAVPADTPQRPEGSAMTVTYELDVTW